MPWAAMEAQEVSVPPAAAPRLPFPWGGPSENSCGDGGGASASKPDAVQELGVANGGGGGTSAAEPPADSKRKGKRCNKPQELASEPLNKELRLGRCFTFKQQDYQQIFFMLEKAFKKKAMIADGSHSLAHGAPVSSNSELLRGRESEACPKLPSST